MEKKRRYTGPEHDGDAFIRESEQRIGSHEDLSEFLGEEFVRSATGSEEDGEEMLNEVVPEEMGGPFLETEAGEEFGRTVSGLPDDEIEERGAEVNAFPAAVGPLGVAALDEREARAPGEEEVLDDDEELEDEEALQAEAEVPSEIEPDSEVLEPETERPMVPKH